MGTTEEARKEVKALIKHFEGLKHKEFGGIEYEFLATLYLLAMVFEDHEELRAELLEGVKKVIRGGK